MDSCFVVVKKHPDLVAPATSGHLRFAAKVAPRDRWPPDTGTLQRQYSSRYIAKMADQSR